MSILFHCTFPNKNKWLQSVKKMFKNHKVYQINNKIDFNTIQYAIVWNLPDRILKKLNNLKIIFSLGAGVDHIINLPSYNKTPILRIKDPNMAERMSYHVHSQILIYQLKLNLFQKAQIKRKWLGEQETLLNNKIKVGILGSGFLGTAVGKYLQKLNYSVIGYKKSRSKRKNSFPIFIKKKIENFIKNCDIIVSILPYTKETKSFIDKKFLNKMKKNALLVNVGRGSTLNEKALIQHLKQNKNFHTSLDVFEYEPLIKKSLLWNLKNVTITSHTASVTYLDSAIDYIYSKIEKHIKSGRIKSDVVLKKGY